MADEDRIARVARAPCVADGPNPDAEIPIGTEDIEPNAGGIGYRRTIKGPDWASYAGEAQQVAASLTA